MIYVANDLNREKLNLPNYHITDSDETGYTKFVREAAECFDGAYIFDIQTDEFNRRDATRPCYKLRDPLSLVGEEIVVNHSRLAQPQGYFVESVRVGEDGESIENIVVSMHKGKSFVLDGTLIKSIEIVSNREFERFSVPNVDNLVFRTCCILANGRRRYVKIQQVEVFKTGIDFWDTVGNKRIDKIYCTEGDVKMAISGLDIECITVFDDQFNTIEVIEKAHKYN